MATNQNPFQAFSQFFPQNQNNVAEFFKQFGEFNAPNVDVNKLAQTSRRSFETASEAGKTVTENVQAIARRQAELAREQVETVLKSSKDMMASGSPEINTTKQIELARGVVENSLNNVREISEMVTKSGFEIFDLINRHTAEQLDEISKTVKPKAAARKKAA